jgi:hypothetical protein
LNLIINYERSNALLSDAIGSHLKNDYRITWKDLSIIQQLDVLF